MKSDFTEAEKVLVNAHLQEIIEGTAFRGSNRSRQFLQHIVKEHFAGRDDVLKERLIGIELFSRAPSYDTAEDAIVRVTASDVRRRLFQHYGLYGNAGGVRIALPLGSYTPDITITPPVDHKQTHKEESPSSEELPRFGAMSVSHDISKVDSQVELTGGRALWRYRWLFIVVCNVAILVLIWVSVRRNVREESLVQPWSTLLADGRNLQIIPSDPNIAQVQQYLGNKISASDYANLHTVSGLPTSTGDARRLQDTILRDERIAAFDAQIALRIMSQAKSGGKRIQIRATRALKLSDLRSDSNFVLIGSPQSNPWTGIFDDQLDFRFAFDKESNQDVIVDVHPQQSEQTSYIPTAMGGATGLSYAIIALVQSLDHTGQTLIIAGADSEGTEAVGNLVTDTPRLSDMLRQCGVRPEGEPKYFEMLIKVNTMAGAPLTTDMEACHILSPAK